LRLDPLGIASMMSLVEAAVLIDWWHLMVLAAVAVAAAATVAVAAG